MNEEDFTKDIDMILDVLNTEKDDWQVRSIALANLQLLFDYGVTSLPNFMPSMQRIKQVLGAQVCTTGVA